MARTPRLKVYRTPIGFHDAYVAAPSQKAALAAWGSDANLFARGIAEQVDDPALIAEPLARPGVVIRRSRGSAAEQIAALPKNTPRKTVETAEKAAPARPKPSRDAVAAAERALADAGDRHRAQSEDLARRERDLARDRARNEREAARERDRLQARIDAEQDAYAAALRDWQG